nr:DUF3500 domain-containing protein [Pseudarthrobacter albicanus]
MAELGNPEFMQHDTGLRLENGDDQTRTLYGDPPETEPWGWQLFGHHLAINCLVAGTRMVMTPVFFGAEPNCIDEGPYQGAVVFEDRIRLGRELMQSLPAPLQQKAQTFREMVDPAMPEGRVHPGDERHLAAPSRTTASSLRRDPGRRNG